MSRSTLLLSIAILLVSLCIFSAFGQDQPILTLYDEQPPNDSYSVVIKRSLGSLPEELWNPYICSTGGVWIVYHVYHSGDTMAKPYQSGQILTKPCCEVAYEYEAYTVEGIHLIESSKNTSIPTINLFLGESWTTPEASNAFTSNQPSYYGIFHSVIVTGSDAVTFYTENNYNGEAICLQTGIYGIPFAGDLFDLGGVSPGTIKSFRFGCFSSNIYTGQVKGAGRNLTHHIKTGDFPPCELGM